LPFDTYYANNYVDTHIHEAVASMNFKVEESLSGPLNLDFMERRSGTCFHVNRFKLQLQIFKNRRTKI
jgi:hypothetical protein